MAYIDASITTPFTMQVYGARGSGKSEFTKQLLLNQEKYLDKPFSKIIWIYKHYQHKLFDPLIKKFGSQLELLDEIPNFESVEKQNTLLASAEHARNLQFSRL